MAKLTTKARKRIKPSNFALPGRRYPIEDASHARNALARVSQHGSSAEKAEVREKVHAKYPDIGQSNHNFGHSPAKGSHGYGYKPGQHSGHHRVSGHSGAHRIGKR